jgi:hypothetical protein
VRSGNARHGARLGLLAACGLLLLGAASGCSTTQETAARKQAESRRILEAREKDHGHTGKHRSKREQ